jgi:hypothetical protein
MKPIIKLTPSRGPMVYRSVASMLLSLSLVVQFDWSNKHIILAVLWLALLMCLVAKDLFDWLVGRSYYPVIVIADDKIAVQSIRGATNYKDIYIKEIKEIILEVQEKTLSIILKDGNTVSVDISRLNKKKLSDAINYMEQRMAHCQALSKTGF